jgi:hypothetical protein
LKATEEQPGDNQDILKECKGVERFSWGNKSNATYCLSLVCCFYLQLEWVMCRFFLKEFEKAPQGDINLFYGDDALDPGYLYARSCLPKNLLTLWIN